MISLLICVRMYFLCTEIGYMETDVKYFESISLSYCKLIKVAIVNVGLFWHGWHTCGFKTSDVGIK